MKPEAQRIAIAQACGWTDVYWNGVYSDFMGKKPGSDRDTFGIPNYLTDLNAMHETEKVLTDDQKHEFEERLSHEFYFPTMTTAAQRAEAFLRTLNLWQE